MMQRLHVMLTLPDGQRMLCGEIFTTTPDLRGKIEGSFRYTKEYLSHPDAFALDPAHLPLSPADVATQRSQGVQGVFEDALPDNWGRELLSKRWNIPRSEQTMPNFLKFLGSNGLGALSFYTDKEAPSLDPSGNLHDLSRLVDAALNYDAGLPVEEDDLRILFSCSSSPGGYK